MNDENRIYERLEEEGIITNGVVNVTFVTGGDYATDVMQYGHGLELRNHVFAVEKKISLEVLQILDQQTPQAKQRWIRLRTYNPVGINDIINRF